MRFRSTHQKPTPDGRLVLATLCCLAITVGAIAFAYPYLVWGTW